MLPTDHAEAALASLETVTTTEARLAVSIGIVLAALAVAAVVVPLVVRRSVDTVGRGLHESNAGSLLEIVDDVLNVPFPRRAVVRSVQSVLVLVAFLALLVLWGYGSVASSVLTVLATALPYALRGILTVGLLLGAVVGTRYLEQRLEEWLADANYVTAHQEGVVFRVLQVTIFIAVGLAALSLWQIDLGGLLVGAGFLGIVMGMAARQTLGSLIAGFVLMFSRPFEIGDWVQVGDHEGMIVDITITNTRLRSFDGETVVLPNDHVSSATVVNRSKRNRLRLRLEVGVDYETDLEHAESVAVEAMEAVDDVAPAPKPQVIPTAFDDSAITLECRFWIRQPNAHKKWTTIRAVVHELKAAYDREEIGIPYPQREHSARSGGGFSVPMQGRDGEELAYSETE
ncbi:mechanosensitive ion channel family protein [Natrarchaeobaculum sulfurireducens]|uniref:Small-conductance mechanosensitive channel n=1 Tax=Natrarchaeobaculum sulfurireducens TaxID=2044521 RepID=A0A346PNV2_9EURY|nr:mechanosensitive ion channel family protein [Natrarchaeobaculum sulfurireducens]AXR78753.1 Small-conductance mechanosensitive channel [Natrarchaeobaculum sulfurireducens]AXR81197.1 Small-conductance mechanosensitive channel [Natrarchaeobaculum sulfurireducens]